MRTLPPRPEMERAFLAGDAGYDAVFVAGVRSTGIFCRPSCPARKPLPKHLEFFSTAAGALAAGYRACLRCQPLDRDRTPAWVPQVIDLIDRHPDRRLDQDVLAAHGVDPVRARRAFSRHFGMSLAAYARARRLGRALDRLRGGARLDEVVFESGFESHSGFREAFERLAGRPPGEAASIGRVALDWFDTPVGRVVAGATDAGVCLLEFADRRALDAQMATLRRRLGAVLVPGESPHLERLGQQLLEYFAGARRRFSLPLVAPGTPFEMCVWEALQQVPYGETRTYQQVARAIGRPDASRAVGRANGMNRIALLIPCHRIVGSDGELVGYAGGVWRKRLLLQLERSGEPVHAAMREPEPAAAGR